MAWSLPRPGVAVGGSCGSGVVCLGPGLLGCDAVGAPTDDDGDPDSLTAVKLEVALVGWGAYIHEEVPLG